MKVANYMKLRVIIKSCNVISKAHSTEQLCLPGEFTNHGWNPELPKLMSRGPHGSKIPGRRENLRTQPKTASQGKQKQSRVQADSRLQNTT